MGETPEPFPSGDSRHEAEQVRKMATDAGLSESSSESDELGKTQHAATNEEKKSDLLSNSEIVKLIRRHQSARENAEVAVGQLERRLRLLEKSESMKIAPSHFIQDNLSCTGQAPCEQDFTGHYSCIYVSPIYDDKKGNVMYRTQIVEDGPGMRSTSFNDWRRHDEKDLDIKRLKAEVQKQDLEIRRLKADLQRLKLHDVEAERSIISDKFVDTVNTRTCSLLRTKVNNTQNEAVTGSALQSVNSIGYLNTHVDMYCYSSDSKNPQSENVSYCFDKKNMAEGKVREGPTPDIDRAIQVSDCSSSDKLVLETVASYLSIMVASVENLCNDVRLHDSTDNDTFKIYSGAIEDELFILKKTLSKLAELCPNCSHQMPLSEDEPCHDDKWGDNQARINGLMQQIAQTEFKVIALESSCMEKDRRIEDLEGRIQSITKEIEAGLIEKYDLTTMIQEMYKEAEEQRHRMEELLSINEELLEFSQAKEQQLSVLRNKARNRRILLQETLEQNAKLSEMLARRQKLLKSVKEEEESLRNRNELLKLKLSCTEFELAQREFALERLTSPFKLDLEMDDNGRDELEYCNHLLRCTNNMEQNIRSESKEALKYIQEFEEKLLCMDAEVSQAFAEMPVLMIGAF